jgi:hypothetical protein
MSINQKTIEITEPANCMDTLTEEGKIKLNTELKKEYSIQIWCNLTKLQLFDFQ